MRWLIRRVVKKGKGSISYEEDVHYGDVLTIGRGSDQAIFLPDLRAALNHAQVTSIGAGRYTVESLIIAGIRVNGEITYSATAGAGSTIEIGATRLQLLEPPRDYDAAVEVAVIDKGEQQAEKERRAQATQLSQTWLSKRRPSWALFVLTLLLGLGLPMLSHYSPGLADTLRAVPLPSRNSWQAGELAAAHHFFGQECETCHALPFRWVRDQACLGCHAKTPAHADPAKFNLPELGDARCADCHRDHNGKSGLIRDDQILCDDCHSALQERSKGASQLANVSDFGSAHPPFALNLPAWDANGVFAPQRVSMTQTGLVEQSGLKFPHDKHLKLDGLNTPGGRRTLVCASCHETEPGGGAMLPVRFETMCHDCHRLAFDTLAPQREVPHGKVEEVQFMLDEFYAKRALDGDYNDATAPTIVRERRRPGSPPLSRQEQQEALSWARDKSRTVGESLFTGRACSTCHAVTPPPAFGEAWRIAPVRVAGVWFAKAHFSHAKHGTMVCADCHAAVESKSSADLLLPPIENCRTCHGGEKARDKVASTCIACHGFHESKTLLQAGTRLP